MNIFTYGSLMYPSVFEALTEKMFRADDVTLNNYQRRAISFKNYPGIKYKPGASVNGRLWFDVDEVSSKMLDRFEDSLYERRVVKVTSKLGEVFNAHAYVVPVSLEHMLASEEWDQKMFQEMHLNSYVEMCRRFRTENINLV